MIITYNNGNMIVTHSSGHVDTYTLLQINKALNKLSKEIGVLEKRVTELKANAEAITASET